MKPMKVSAGKAEEYYYQADPLFSLDGDHKFIGDGAKALGLFGNVNYEQFTNLLNGMSPDGERRIAGREADHGKYAAVDMPVSIPKSFSILAIIDPVFKEELAKTLIKSAENIEEYVYGRQTVDGQTEQVKGKMIGAAFMHSTSRAGDPNIHCHAVICNVVQRPDGSYSTLENRQIFVNQAEHQQSVYSDLAALAHKHGYATDLSTNKGGMVVPEIKGISGEVNKQFSKRHEDISNAVSMREDIQARMPGLSAIEVDNLVQLNTKAAKDRDLSADDLNKSFNTQLKGLSTSAGELLSEAKLAGLTRIQTDLSPRDFIKMAAADLSEAESVTSQKDIIGLSVKLATGSYVKADLQQAFCEAVNSGDIVDLKNGHLTTPEIQNAEHHIAKVAVEQAHQFMPLLNKEEAAAAISAFEEAKGFSTTAGQAAAIEYVLTGEGRLLVIQGDAGAGKSTAFDAINRALDSRDDIQVKGLGFQGKAAAGLEQSAGIRSGTIDGFLQSKSGWNGETRQLWVIDEASMVGSKHLGALVARAENENAQIVLVGDQKQLAAISAGILFKDLQDHGLVNTAIMAEVRRQKTDYTKDVATALKSGDSKTAIDILNNKGQIHEGSDRGERTKLAAELYMSRGEGTTAITVTNRERLDLIQEIRGLEKTAGIIGAEDFKAKTREPVSLRSVEKRFASSYSADNSVFINQNIPGLKRGSEARILSTNTANNTITVADQNNKEVVIDILKNGDKVSQFTESETSFAVGEKVIWTKNDNTAEGKADGVKNGITGEIMDIKDGIATIKTEHGSVVEQKLEGSFITNGQAVTIYKSQGVTATNVVAVISSDDPAALLSKEMFYVAGSRMTDNIDIVTDNKEKLVEAVEHRQEKTSTLDHSDDLLDRLKELRVANSIVDESPSSWKENNFAEEKKQDYQIQRQNTIEISM